MTSLQMLKFSRNRSCNSISQHAYAKLANQHSTASGMMLAPQDLSMDWCGWNMIQGCLESLSHCVWHKVKHFERLGSTPCSHSGVIYTPVDSNNATPTVLRMQFGPHASKAIMA